MPTAKLAQLAKRYDRGRALDSLNALPDQIRGMWQSVGKWRLPASHRSVDSVVVSGMGGSGWPAKIVYSIFRDRLAVPYTVVNGYNLPASVGPSTLCVCSSYSGGTEEVISGLKQARQKRAKAVVLASGGQLAALAKQWRIPALIFDPKDNPSNQPRLGSGYMIFGTVGILTQAGLVRVSSGEVAEIVRLLKRNQVKLSRQAQVLSERLVDRSVLLIGAEHLDANIEGFRNQIHENAKHFAASFPLPDLNHHLMESLKHPAAAKTMLAVFLDSDLYSPRIKTRLKLTRQVFERQGVPTVTFQAFGPTKLAESMAAFGFGGYVSFWLSMRHRQDPGPIKWVDWFKARLKK